MKLRQVLMTILLAVVCFAPVGAQEARQDLLPEALRERGVKLLGERNDAVRARLADELVRADAAGARAFLLALMAGDPAPAVRLAIVSRLGRLAHPEIRQALERSAAGDADAAVSLLALERLRALEAQDLQRLLYRRIELARQSGDTAGLQKLAVEHERWVSLVRGVMLPGFMRRPPATFSLKAAGEPVRILAFGDYGNGSEHQKRTAAAMLAYHRRTPFDFAVTLGDNFYSVGMDSPDDPRWKTWWEDLYTPLGIQFYATLGNHDWGQADSPAAEMLYTAKSRSWRLPALYYTYTAGPVQFFALDTNEVSEAQLLWLDEELKKSTARWKVAYCHHPIYSAGAHGDNQTLIRRLLPLLKGRVDVYLAGHDHDLQHLKAEDGVHFFVAGGGGAGIRPVKSDPRALFAKSSYGFAVVEADAERLKVKFVSSDSPDAEVVLYEYALTGKGARAVTSR